MRRDFFDRYSRLDTAIHRCSAEAKLVLAIVVVGITVGLPVLPLAYCAAVVSGLLAAILAARIPLTYVAWRLGLMSPFVLGLAALGPAFGTLVGKSALCLTTMVLLANTTPFDRLLEVLRRARVPGLFVTTLALMYRYAFVLVDEATRMRRARLARTFSGRRRWPTLATVAGQLFVRSTERAERIHSAMLARGWR